MLATPLAFGTELHERGTQTEAGAGIESESASRRYRTSGPQTPVLVESSPLATPASPTSAQRPRDDRDRLSAPDAGDYLKKTPGFSLVQSGGVGGDVVFRGQSGSRVQFVMDGTMLEGGCGGRMDPPTAYITPDRADVIEIIKGPQTVLWGPTGSAGTVRFEQRAPRHGVDAPLRFHGSSGVGSAGRNDQSIDLAVVGPQLDARVIARHAGAMDLRDGDGQRLASRWDKREVSATLGVQATSQSRLSLELGTSQGYARYAARDKDGARQQHERLTLRYTHQRPIAQIDGIDAQLYLNRVDHIMDNFSLRAPPTSAVTGRADRQAAQVDHVTTGGRFAVSVSPAQAWTLTSGIDAKAQRHSRRLSTAGVASDDLGHRPWSPDARLQRFGFFTESSWDLPSSDTANSAANTRIVTGARIDRVQARDLRTASHAQRQAWLPSAFVRFEQAPIAPTYAPTYDRSGLQSASYYVGIGHTQRFPDYWELFSAAGPTPSVNAFHAIRPERTTQIDFGARIQHGRGGQAWLNAYVGRVDDAILFDYAAFAGPGVSKRTRQVDAWIAGAELGGEIALTPYWTSTVSIASAWGRNIDDHRPMPQIAPLELRAGLRYQYGAYSALADGRLVLAQRRVARGQGNVAGQDCAPSSSFTTLALSTSYAHDKRTRLSAGLDNVFDRRYSEHLNKNGSTYFGYATNARIRAPGRLWWARIDVDF